MRQRGASVNNRHTALFNGYLFINNKTRHHHDARGIAAIYRRILATIARAARKISAATNHRNSAVTRIASSSPS